MASKQYTGKQKIGLALMGLGGGLTGKDVLGNYMQNENEQAFRQWQMEHANRQLATDRQKIMMDQAYKNRMLKNGVPIYTIGPDGSPVFAGSIPQGGKVITPASMMTPDAKADIEVTKTAQKDLNTWTSNATDALGALNKIEQYAQKLPNYKTGFLNQVGAKSDAMIREFSKDPKFTEYLGVVAQELIPMARKLAEEKGPITEWDVKRVEKGFGDRTTPFEQRVTLIKELRGKLQKAARNKMQNAKMSELEFAVQYGDLYGGLFPERAQGIASARQAGYSDDEITKYLEKAK